MRTVPLSSICAIACMTLLLTGCHLVPLFPTHAESSGQYDIDTGHSAVVFEIEHLGVAKFYGRFNQVNGKLTLDLDEPQNNTLLVKVPSSSLDTNSSDRDQHIAGEEFLNVARHPEITFRSTAFQRVGPAAFRVTGDLTLLDQTRSITVDLQQTGYGKDPWGGHRTGFHTTFSVNRRDYGITALPGGLGDIVTLRVTLEAKKVQPAKP